MKNDKLDKKILQKLPNKEGIIGKYRAKEIMNCDNDCVCQKCKKKNQQHGIVQPIVNRYFFICPENIVLSETTYTLNADQFVDDQGEVITFFRTYGSSGYTNLFINCIGYTKLDR